MKKIIWISILINFCSGQKSYPQYYQPTQQQLEQFYFSHVDYPQKIQNIPLGLIKREVDAVTTLLTKDGYANEVHRIETEDGYRLKLHRILPKIPREKKGPVMLCHGLFGTAADFILTGPNIALAYHLANDGYDVWMVNSRGSKYSMRHRMLNPKSFQFWMFSFHEIGMYDYSASIDYVLRTTTKNGIYFVGHNQACTALLVLLSMRPQYNPKIIQAHLMGPIAWMDHIHPMIEFNIDRRMQSTYLTRTFNFYSLSELVNVTLSTYCDPRDPSALMYCVNLWFFMFGRNRNGTEIDPNILLLIPNHISPTASLRQWNHFLQIYKKGRFQTYDGREDSYFEGNPVEYNLLNVKTPIVLYHASEDMIVSKLDVDHLMTSIAPNVRSLRVIENWNHMDFLFSRNGRIMVYDYILNQFNGDIDFTIYLKNLLTSITTG